MKKINLNWKPEVLFSVLSLSVSLFSLSFIVIQTNIMQSQQQASVWPYLELKLGILENKFYVDVQNKGVGPAIVEFVEFEHKGIKYDSFEKLAKFIVNDSTFNYSNIITVSIQKSVLSASEKIRIFQANELRHATKLIYATSDIKIKIRYRSIYGKKWERTDGEVKEKKL
ncbi:MAG: hypothetical protein H7Y04_05635 [Verrucomicrobia bacterium]|nr:hypothetical protein [Cytophagales bacterium]